MSKETIFLMRQALEYAEILQKEYPWLNEEETKDIAITMFIHETRRRV